MEQKKLLKIIQQYNEFHNIINRINTIFINSKNSKVSDPHRLLLHSSDKIDSKKNDKGVDVSNLSIYYEKI